MYQVRKKQSNVEVHSSFNGLERGGFLKTPNAAYEMGVSQDTLRGLIYDGGIKAHVFEGLPPSYFIKKDQIKDFIEFRKEHWKLWGKQIVTAWKLDYKSKNPKSTNKKLTTEKPHYSHDDFIKDQARLTKESQEKIEKEEWDSSVLKKKDYQKWLEADYATTISKVEKKGKEVLHSLTARVPAAFTAKVLKRKQREAPHLALSTYLRQVLEKIFRK